MKGILILLTMMTIWYFAGMFRQSGMLTLMLCLGIVAVLLTFLAIYQKYRFRLSMDHTKDIAFKGVERAFTLTAENKSILPVNRYRMTVAMKYSADKKPVVKRLNGCAGGKNMKDSSTAEFFFQAPYCGVIDVELKKAKVYDPMSVFSSTKKIRQKGQILVFPVEKEMHIVTPSVGSYDNLPVADSHSNRVGDDHSEVHQIREYRPGDLIRHIHQNYSAKTDSIWVKEFSRENDYVIDLFLDTSNSGQKTTEDWDAFYEIVYSVAVSLLKKEFRICAHWFDRKKNGVVEMQLDSLEDCAEMLAEVYLADKNCSGSELFGAASPDTEGTMVINTGLDWYFSGQPVYRFTKEKVENELSVLSFRLQGR